MLFGQSGKCASNSSKPQTLDLIVPAWNKLSAKQQFDPCAGVDTFGADWAANQVQEATGLYNRDAHKDIVYFLKEMACS